MKGGRLRWAARVFLTLGALCVSAGGIEVEQAEAPTEYFDAGNGHRLAVRRWRPGTGYRPRAVLIVQHGAQTHSAYFASLGRALPVAGFECVAFDHQGTKDARLASGMRARRPRAASTGVSFARGEAGVAVPAQRIVLRCAGVQRCPARMHGGGGREVRGDGCR